MLSNSQRALLAARLRQGRENTASTAIPRRPPGSREIPLSHGQEQLWFLDQLAPGLPTYNIAGLVRMAGPLDTAALGAAFDALAARHEALRTRLVSIGDRPCQVIDDPAPVRVPVTDLGAVPAGEQEERWRELAAQEAALPFALDLGPLLRVLLLRLSDTTHVLVVTVHHTVFDGWSFPVLLAELSELYAARTAGREARLPELPVQFADFAIWERDRLQGESLDKLVEYWRGALDGAPVLQLPTDRPRPLVQTYDGGAVSLDLGDEVLTGLKALGRQEGTTLFVTLMAAFHVLLHRYSGQDDIVVGTVSANRGRPELEPLIGFLVNTLPVRADLSGDPTFTELLERVRTATLGAYAHQDLPFAKIVDALRVPRDPSRSPLFQVGFMLAESQERDLPAGELVWASEELPSAAAKFDLLVSVTEADGRLAVGVSYASALFDGATVERMLGHFRVLLDGVVADPARRLSRLPIMPEAELRQEITDWNADKADYPHWCLHEKFQAQAAATPDAVAVELDGATVTYAELNAQANRIARRLRELGVGPEVLVGVSTQRTPRRIAGLLGILKAGGGYVPLDPDYPADRLAFMVEDAEMPVVVTDRASEAAVPAGSVAVLSLDGDWDELSTLDGSDLEPAAAPDNVAYVIYTSGSTGRPKGVVVEHSQAVNFATAEIEHWPLGTGDRVLQFASLNFDVSVLDVFGALLSGAALVLGSTETLLSPPRLADLIRDEGITFMCLPPAVLNLLAEEQFPSLRVVIAGGEAFSSELVRDWARPGMRFINGYGPTETTVGSTMAECHDNGIDPPPIGLPLTNYTAYVLDKHLNPVPVGVIGELHIGGAGVTRGYLNRPELTAERFVRDPFATTPDARMYKTGDLARRLPDGNLQFLGRSDDQVKIRGLRVELGEIEAVLASHPSVAQAAILVGEDRTGQKQLIGYARTGQDAPATSQAELRVHLAERLPAYMVPTHLVILEKFPLNANGKVDRSALPAPDSTDSASTYIAPRTLIETVLVDMYGGLLNLKQVGIEDNFFDLGGNSLQAMQLIAGLRKDLAVDTDATAIFLAPTPAQLASALCTKYGLEDTPLDEAGLDELGQLSDEDAAALLASLESTGTAAPSAPAASGPLVPMTDGPGTDPLYLVHAVGGTVFAYAALAKELADRYQVYGIEAAGLRPGTTAAHDLEELVDRYVDAVRAAQPAGPYRLAGWSMGGLIALEMARRFEAAGEEVSLVGLLDSPLRPDDVSGASEVEFAAQFVLDAARALGPDAGPTPDRETATVAEQLRWLGDRLAGSGDREQVAADIERRFEVFKAHLSLIGGYRPAAVGAPVLVVGAAGSLDLADEWAAILGARTALRQVPGDHYSFLQGAGVRAIAEAI